MILIIYITITTLLFGESCIFKLVLGIPCPSCGVTRAWKSIFMLKFEDAFYYHPLFLLVPVIGIVLLYKDEFNIINRIYNYIPFWILVLVCIITCYILRWIFVYPNAPMNLNENSLLFTVIRLIKKLFDLT